MGAGHSHTHRAGDDFEVPRVRRLVLLWVLGLTAVATVVGVALLWPDGGKVDDLQDSVSFAKPGRDLPAGDGGRGRARLPGPGARR